MKPNVEQQEAWFADQFRAMAADLDIEVDVLVHPTNAAMTLGLAKVPDTIHDVVEARIQAIMDESDRRFAR